VLVLRVLLIQAAVVVAVVKTHLLEAPTFKTVAQAAPVS
jgi:hypothetical protein